LLTILMSELDRKEKQCDCLWISDGPGSKIFDQGRVNFLWLGLGQPFMVWVWIWKIPPKNVKFFNFFPIGSKKISSGQVWKYPGWRQVSLLFTAGQNYSRVRSGQGPSLLWILTQLHFRFTVIVLRHLTLMGKAKYCTHKWSSCQTSDKELES